MLEAYFVEVAPLRDWDFRCDNLAFANTPEEAMEICKPWIDPPLEDDNSHLKAERKPGLDHLKRPDKTEAYVERKWETLRQAGFMTEDEDPCDNCGLYALGFDEHWVDPETLLCNECAKLLEGREDASFG